MPTALVRPLDVRSATITNSFRRSPRLFATNHHGVTLNELWRYVNAIMGRRLGKKDILKLLRLDPKSVGACVFY